MCRGVSASGPAPDPSDRFLDSLLEGSERFSETLLPALAGGGFRSHLASRRRRQPGHGVARRSRRNEVDRPLAVVMCGSMSRRLACGHCTEISGRIERDGSLGCRLRLRRGTKVRRRFEVRRGRWHILRDKFLSRTRDRRRIARGTLLVRHVEPPPIQERWVSRTVIFEGAATVVGRRITRRSAPSSPLWYSRRLNLC